MKQKALVATVLLALALVLAAGCSSKGGASPPKSGSSAAAAVGELPEYAYRSALSLKGYQIAVRERELLSRLPCYCGCGADAQYQSLRDCFLNEDGLFNSHGANCQVCLEEAVDADDWKGRGRPVKEIRAKIDAKYQGRGKPTDTPPVDD